MSRFGESSLDAGDPTQPLRMRARRAPRAARSSFGVLTVSQRPSWRNASSRPSAASSGNVVVSWSPRSGKPLERLVAEDVDAAVHPVRQHRRLAEAVTRSSSASSTTPNGDGERRDGDRRGGGAVAVVREQRDSKSTSTSSSPFSAKTSRSRAGAAAANLIPPPRPSGSGSPATTISAPSPPSSRSNSSSCPARAADDHALDAGAREPRDLVRGERPAATWTSGFGRRPRRRRAARPCRRRG